MSLKLGAVRKVKITVRKPAEEGAEQNTLISLMVSYRDPGTKGYLAFRRSFSEVFEGLEFKDGKLSGNPTMEKSLRLADAWAELGKSCFLDCEGLEDLEGNPVHDDEALDLLSTYGDGEMVLEALGEHVARQFASKETQTGKGVQPSS